MMRMGSLLFLGKRWPALIEGHFEHFGNLSYTYVFDELNGCNTMHDLSFPMWDFHAFNVKINQIRCC